MTLIRTGFLNGIAVSIKIATLLCLNKVLAIYVGPAGYAAIGQFQNAIQMINVLASGAVNTGITKYTAEYSDDARRLNLIWKTAGTLALVGSAFFSVLVIFFNRKLSYFFLDSYDYGSIFIWFAAFLVFFIFNNFLLAILNGKKDVRRYVLSSIVGSILSLIVTSVMAFWGGLYGALLALAIYQSLAFGATLFFVYKAEWFKVENFFGAIDRESLKNLSKYALMAITSAVCVPISHILIRNYLGKHLGWDAAGNWEAMWRLSAAYLMLITTTLSVYYLPRISEIKKSPELKREIAQGYKIVFPLTCVIGFLMYLLRDFIINTLFTSEFHGMKIIFGWQIFGDILKIGSWLIAYVIVGKAMTKVFLFSEIFFSFLFYFLVIVLIDLNGLVGVAQAYSLNILFYWAYVAWFVRNYLNEK
ncbi:O-antigen translocase [Comamonas aquatica]|nr:O-antigen translocase [Comamonas aquatica]